MVHGDQLKLKQILLNLLSNAIRYTDSGSISLKARLLETEPEALYVRFSVADTGTGISEEIMAHLFEPFTQGISSRLSKARGAGLGLSICRQLAGLMGGRIWAESSAGHGSSFYLDIPFTQAANPLKRASRRKIFNKIGRTEKKLTILVVEDNYTNMLAYVRLLEKLGFLVISADNGKKAVDICARGGIDLVLMDIQMPEMGGVEAFREIRKTEAGSERKVPIVAITANVLVTRRVELSDEGFDGVLYKPFKIDQLICVLEDLLV